MSVLNLIYLQRLSQQFCNLKEPFSLEYLLVQPLHQLILLGQNPPYHHFSLRKKNGKLRHIESPNEPLKTIQKELNKYLQSVYWLYRTDAAYGFISAVKRDSSPRNIRTNAEKHLYHPYLLNIDMKDFFHQISWNRVFKIFYQPPFDFNRDLAELLTNLTTYNGRLPMGTPTSPVLSNFASIDLYYNLLNWTNKHHIVYTRYADDLSFSSTKPIVQAHREAIMEIIANHDFVVNLEKVKYYGKEQVKEVTGLIVGEKRVLLPQDYFDELRQWTEQLRTIIEIKQRSGGAHLQQEPWMKKFLQQIEGKLTFVGMIYGEDSDKMKDWNKKYIKALTPPEDLEDFGSADWLSFPYAF